MRCFFASSKENDNCAGTKTGGGPESEGIRERSITTSGAFAAGVVLALRGFFSLVLGVEGESLALRFAGCFTAGVVAGAAVAVAVATERVAERVVGILRDHKETLKVLYMNCWPRT